MDLYVIVQGNMYPGVLFKTKIMNGVYTRCLLDYNVIVSEAPRKHQGGGSTLLPQLPPLSDRGEPVFCPHVFIFQLVTRQKRWFVSGCYVLPDSAAETDHITKAL